MARISVDQKALTDPRFRALGNLLQPLEKLERQLVEQCTGLYLAIRVWDQCQERGSDVLPFYLVECIADGLVEAMITAELAEKIGPRKLRIKGAKERCLWLKERREIGREGGKLGGRPTKSHETTHENGNPRGLSDGKPQGVIGALTPGPYPWKTPPTPTPTPTPESPVPELLPVPASRADARKSRAGVSKPDHPSPEFTEWWDTYRAALTEQGRACGYKRASWDTWKAQKLDQHVAGILDRLRAQLAFWRRSQGNGKFAPLLPDPHRWLKQKRWNDEVPKSWERQA